MSRPGRMSVPLTCAICGKEYSPGEGMPAEVIRPSVQLLIARDHPDFGPGHFICLSDLNRYRYAYVQDTLASERGAVSLIDQEILQSLRDQETVAQNINLEFEQRITFGERIADRLASVGGSWTFIIVFLGLLVAWMLVNSIQLLWRPFDHFPFILLNLVLSCVAALQAPVIMMSQKRQEARDRLRAEQDYRTNLKAEIEVRYLNSKMDELLSHQWVHLVEIQQIQMELMEELMARLPERRT